MKNNVVNFNKNGFVILKNVINKKEVHSLFKEIEIIKKEALKTKNKRYFHLTSDHRINTIHNIQKFYKSKKLLKLSKNQKILKFLKSVLSKNIFVRNFEFFLKPAKTGMASPPHQDNFFWNIADSKAANVWIALSDSNKKNGGIYYLKGSQKLGMVDNKPSQMKGTSQKVEFKKIRKKNFKKIFPNLKMGDCLVHHCEIIHGSYKNQSKSDRVGIAISYKNKLSKINFSKKKEYEKKLNKFLKTI